MRKPIIILLVCFSVLILADSAEAALGCQVRSGGCYSGETTVFKMSATTNAHAELPGQANYNYYVCCGGVTNLGNSCSGNYAVVLRLSGATNAHVERNNYSNYFNYACLSGPSGYTIECAYASSCTGDWVGLASISAATNAHVGSYTAYATKVCCRVIEEAPDPTGTLSCKSATQTSITLSYSFSNSASGQVSLFRGTTGLTTFSGTSGSGDYTDSDSGLSPGTSYTYYLRDGTSSTSPLLASRTCSTLDPAVFDFSISVSPTSGSTDQGGSVSATVDATLTSGSTQSVSFSASGLPSGASASFSPSSCNPSCFSTMTIDTAATTPTGSYSINVCGEGGGLTRCATYELTVTEAKEVIDPPDVTTDAATYITQTSATLNGTLEDMGNADSVLVWFEWGPTADMTNSTEDQTMTSAGSFSADLDGLSPDTNYYFEAFAKSGGSW